MKKLFLLLPLFILLSCSVQKRKYQKGFYVNWKHKKEDSRVAQQPARRMAKPADITVVVPPQEKQQPQATAALAGQPLPLPAAKPSVFRKDEPCDVIVFKDGTEISAKISEIGTNEIKYKRCELSEGPVYVAKKSEIFMIKYANGTREVFKNEPDPYRSNQNTTTKKPGGSGGEPKTHPMAITALVFSILGIWPITGIFSIVGLIMANSAIKQIRANPDKYKGEDLATTARIISIITLAIIGIILLFVLLLLAAL